jgi:DNA repair protein RecN (Recombination protein N)
MRELGEQLIDIHGQHAWQSLTRPMRCATCWMPMPGLDTALWASCWQDWRQADKTLAGRPAAQDTCNANASASVADRRGGQARPGSRKNGTG